MRLYSSFTKGSAGGVEDLSGKHPVSPRPTTPMSTIAAVFLPSKRFIRIALSPDGHCECCRVLHRRELARFLSPLGRILTSPCRAQRDHGLECPGTMGAGGHDGPEEGAASPMW